MNGKIFEEPFKEMVELRWKQFCELEASGDLDNIQGAVAAIIRNCANSNLKAIRMALERLDGRLDDVLNVKQSHFYFVYPNAKKALGSPRSGSTTHPKPLPELEVPSELPTGSLRAVLKVLIKDKQSTTQSILDTAKAIEAGEPVFNDNNEPSDGPYAKSVMGAGLMKLVHEGNMKAIYEVFNQIDGKVVSNLKIGEDFYVQRFDEVAPEGAYLNEDGIYVLDGGPMNSIWQERLGDGRLRR